jgi:aryl-alcohol dehydrogenase-like predicted oxidoreductase
MVTRRDWLRISATAGAALTLDPRVLSALQSQDIVTRAIPSTGERIPVVGLGGANTFSAAARSGDIDRLTEVLRTMVDNGATVLDTAPGYGASEEVSGQIAQDLGMADRIFWATKLNVAGRGGGGRGGRGRGAPATADPTAARAQVERSFERLRTPVIDLIQVHNLGDPPVQLGILQEYKAEGRVRYIGITTTSGGRYPDLVEVMREYPLDFIGIDYAIDNRAAADMIFPLAQELGIAVMVYLPFGRNRLWSRVEGRDVPEWAADFGATTWAQFFLKFAIAHPAVTVVTPGTSNAEHMLDNVTAQTGRIPNEDEIARMVDVVDELPPPPPRRRGGF